MRRKPKRPGNAVADAIERVGGVARAAMVCRVSETTLRRWCRKGRVRLLGPAVRPSRAAAISIERLAGL